MTSKALEAAYDEAVGIRLMIDSPAEIARIIRAFAKNLSEEAVIAGKAADSRRLLGHELQGAGNEMSVKTILAAIEKDLE